MIVDPRPPGGCAEGVDWRAVSPSSLRWKWQGDETAVFNADTGETHLLSLLPAETLHRLCRRPCDALELCRWLARVCEVADDAAWAGQIGRVLNDLAALELIEPSAPAECDRRPSAATNAAVG